MKLQWKPQDPECVPGLIFDANTELQHYWLQIYECRSMFNAGFYGITAEGRFDLMGMQLCRTLDEAKAHAENEWNEFKQRSRLYPQAKRREGK